MKKMISGLIVFSFSLILLFGCKKNIEEKIDYSPKAIIESSIDEVWVNENSFVIYWNCEDLHVAIESCTLNKDGQVVSLQPGDCLIEEAGLYSVVAINEKNKQDITTFEVLGFDVSSPNASISPSGAVFKNDDGLNVDITCSCSDEKSGIFRCELRDGLDYESSILVETSNGEETITNVSDGISFKVYAIDLAGNISSSQELAVYYDNHAPEVSINPSGFYLMDVYVDITWECDDDDGSGIAACDLMMGDVRVASTIGNVFQRTVRVDQEGTFYVYARDKAGNESYSDQLILVLEY